jgi:tRNA uridine 5-carboxymethylaminomethyl modification enzyme
MGHIITDFSLGNRVEIEVKYEGYIEREIKMINKLSELEKESIPAGIDYELVKGLSNEARNKLKEIQPVNLDQASRIQGIGPTDIITLLLHLRKNIKIPEP